MVEREFDILVIGATGYTGRLVVEYLANHSRASSLHIALGGRTTSKVQDLANKYQSIGVLHVDVDEEHTVQEAVSKTRVVINIAGPYWTRGSVVVRACARNGVHYVDLTGEAPWVSKVIEEYDYLAYQNRACIIPCSGYDSIPADIATYLSVRALEKQLNGKQIEHISSTTAHRLVFHGGMSGGTAATLFSHFEDVPREHRRKGSGWGLSPMAAPSGYRPVPKILYSLPHIKPTVWGGYFILNSINAPIVRRSWGLRNYTLPLSKRPTFSYTEFQNTGSRVKGVLLSLGIMAALAGLAVIPPFRRFLKWLLPKSGEGPRPETLDRGGFDVINVAEGGGVVVKAKINGDGAPGHRLTSIMIVESALLLLDPKNLTEAGKEGGVLTPSVAYGDALVKALEGTGRFKFEVEVLEDKKTR
ncbi:unnamed protein product [Rhizoctonia solani]|uniref:Saccharopine dehydrogenase NADP binding domain-containing protein n=1 Tax=Rhizoctonia solani TaxID=456999 RepID=A0A8H3BH31_9AGAM|nr:unnamed protein product [Rhizoctonia solani]